MEYQLDSKKIYTGSELRRLREIEKKRQGLISDIEEILIAGRYAKEHLANVVIAIPEEYCSCIAELEELVESVLGKTKELDKLLG
ncbi:hypothetical protein RSO68_12520 [Halomonas saccharevitans]|uniref:Uncharacterized protein n=1 Tax=Halomonas saccharevitans TaxID=416872 RepID=A0ABU3NGK4_9GAMM|nr:hypothetical protein [Halomonas saccharevitans]MDT8880295.1 hypothetical protein [Halomonas saccharevitans]